MRHKLAYFFSLQNETKNGTKSFSLQKYKYFYMKDVLFMINRVNKR